MNLRGFVQRMLYGVTHPEEELTRLQATVRDAYLFGRHGARVLVRTRAPQMAAALAYRTLFSLVPILVVSLVTLKMAYGEEGIRKGLRELMEFTGLSEIRLDTDELRAAAADPDGDAQPTGDSTSQAESTALDAAAPPVGPEPAPPAPPDDRAAAAVENLINEFVNNAVSRVQGIDVGAVTIVSLLVFIYAALSLMIQIEQSFNTVCGARRGRSLVSRVMTYWTLLTLGSILVFASLAMGLGDGVSLPAWMAWAHRPLKLIGDTGAVWILLIFAYTQMPTTRVRLRPAAIGALVSAIVWTACRSGLHYYVSGFTGGQVAVYGAMALLPLFLLWTYVTWLVVLFGLAVAHAIQTAPSAETLIEQHKDDPDAALIDPLAALRMLRLVARAFARGRAIAQAELVERLGVPGHAIESMAARLIDAGFLHRLGEEERPAFALARPAEGIPLDQALQAAQAAIGLGDDDADEAAGDRSRLDSIRQAQLRPLRGVTLASLAAEPEPA